MLYIVKYIYQVPRSLLQNEKNFVIVEFAANYQFSRLKRQVQAMVIAYCLVWNNTGICIIVLLYMYVGKGNNSNIMQYFYISSSWCYKLIKVFIHNL